MPGVIPEPSIGAKSDDKAGGPVDGPGPDEDNVYLNEPDLAKKAMEDLVTTYNIDSAWWRKNLSNPKALNQARGLLEATMSQVAINQHAEAAQTGNVEGFLTAASTYSDYLKKFPFSDDYYFIQFESKYFWDEIILFKRRQLPSHTAHQAKNSLVDFDQQNYFDKIAIVANNKYRLNVCQK